MAPALRVADVVVTDRPERAVAVGSVVNFERPDRDVIHRVVGVSSDGYQTKGDANPTPDSGVVAFDEVHGVGVMLVPFIGAPVLWFEQGHWLRLAALFGLLTVAARVAPRRWLTGLDRRHSPSFRGDGGFAG